MVRFEGMQAKEQTQPHRFLNIDRADVVFALVLLSYVAGLLTAAIADRIHWGVPFPG